MFETAELGHKVDKKLYARRLPKLREDLLEAQYRLLENGTFPVILVIGGVDGAGKGETVNLLTEWMDPRHLRTHAFGSPTDEEAARPTMWRFWRSLPAKGKMGIYLGSWYTDPIGLRVYREIGKDQFQAALTQIASFERTLVQGGALVVKLWFHLSKQKQKERLEELEKDPLTKWRVTKNDWAHFRRYDDFRDVAAHALRETSTAEAPWIVVEGTDARYRSLTAGTALLDLLRKRLEVSPDEPSNTVQPAAELGAVSRKLFLNELDLSARLDKKEYEKKLEKLSGRLNKLSRNPKFQKRAVVCVFEGVDAAGKGGAIRRITRALDARIYEVIPVAAPTEDERAKPYLWRFWRDLPAARGRFTIYDRSWYGRVLVERIEKFARNDEWLRAYSEINDFEEQLVDRGIVVVKFWLHISADEELRRFRERERTSFKRFKITQEDWRNREKWDDYIVAACDMIERTSTDIAPWTTVATNDKYAARIQVMKALIDAMKRAL